MTAARGRYVLAATALLSARNAPWHAARRAPNLSATPPNAPAWRGR